METHCVNDVLVMHPVDKRHGFNNFLGTMHQRLADAKTDMEDLIAWLNQEIAVREYLEAKVKDLEVRIESVKHKSREDIQQAVLLEREMITQIQWDSDELLRKYKNKESRLMVEQELENKTEQLKCLQQRQEELEFKTKLDIRKLVKEVKSLRKSEAELKEVLNQNLTEKSELEKERQRRRQIRVLRKKLIYVYEDLRHRLEESSASFLAAGEDKFVIDPSSVSDALGLLRTSDTRVDILLAKAPHLLDQDNEHGFPEMDAIDDSDFDFADTPPLDITDDPESVSNSEMRKLLSDAIADNVMLKQQYNAVVRCALKMVIKPLEGSKAEEPPRKTILDKILRR